MFVSTFGLIAGLLASPATATSPEVSRKLAEWRAARFGLFIHWGPVALRGTEIGWSRGAEVPVEEYDRLYRRFNPTNFDATAWMALAHDAGMKYVVFTSKHHDGFCMWDTGQTDYSIMHTPFGRDVVKELAVAARSAGLTFSLYHSLCDWRHPDYPLGSPGGKTRKPNPNMDRYNIYLKNQLAELLRNYGPLGVIWFDGEWEEPWTEDRAVDLQHFLRGLQPDLIINNRIGKGRAGMDGSTAAGAFAGDYDTPEQRVGNYQDGRPWETCMTLCQQWAWKPDDRMKSLAECVQTLVRCAGGDGNLLLNIGPMPDGRIEPRQVERLREMGAWLTRNGESIYSTRGGPWKPTDSIASTRRGQVVYLHVLRWEGDAVTLPNIPAKILQASALTGGQVGLVQAAGNVVIRLPAAARDSTDTIIRLELDRPAIELAPIATAVTR